MQHKDQILLQRLDQHIDEHLIDESFGVDAMASAMGYSRSHLHRKVYNASGKSVSRYMREYRLEKALVMLNQANLNVSEVADRVGFGSASYFSRSFTDYFGFPPSEAGNHAVESGKTIPADQQQRKPVVFRIGVPVAVVLLLLVSALWFIRSSVPEQEIQASENHASIALLPFLNLSNDPQNLYFSQGVSDAIARKLSSIENLRVVSRISTSQYLEKQTPITDIARELKTPFVLEGSIQRVGKHVRVEVGLLNGSTGYRLWSENYDRAFEDIFQIENEIAEEVARSLSSALAPAANFTSNEGYTSNSEAYDLYLKGLFELRTYTSTGAKNSTELFRAAIELDPEFAMAYNWLGTSYIARAAMFGMELDALEGLEKAYEYIEKSIEISPDLKETRTMRAFYYLYHDWDFEKADQEYKESLNKTQAESYALYADFLNFVRRHEEALEWSEKQEINEPYYPNPRKVLSLFYLGREEEAIAYAENRLRVQKNYWMMDTYGFVLLNSGRYEEAIDVFHQIFDIEHKRYPRILGWLGAAHARSGEENKARQIIAELKELKSTSSASSPAFFIAAVYAALGEHESALQWLRTAIDDHEMEIPWLISEPQFFGMHEHPGFKKLVEEVGFPS